VEVRIGVVNANRELTLETSSQPDEIAKLVDQAIAAGSGVLSLSDDKGRTVHVPVDKLAYVEVSGDNQRRMGFGAGS
jgi:hypothetical protein